MFLRFLLTGKETRETKAKERKHKGKRSYGNESPFLSPREKWIFMYALLTRMTMKMSTMSKDKKEIFHQVFMASMIEPSLVL